MPAPAAGDDEYYDDEYYGEEDEGQGPPYDNKALYKSTKKGVTYMNDSMSSISPAIQGQAMKRNTRRAAPS